MFLCYYVHDSIVFIIVIFNCFITLLQHVRGQSALCCQINVCTYVCMYICMYLKEVMVTKNFGQGMGDPAKISPISFDHRAKFSSCLDIHR